MTTWELLSANATVLGNAWQRLNSFIDGGTIIRCPSGFMADKVISLDLSTPELILNNSPVEVSFNTDNTVVSFNINPIDYTFTVTAPIETLEV